MVSVLDHAASHELEAPVLAAARSLGAGSSAQRALALLYDENADVDDIAALIEQEPALTARVLKVANSSFYGHAGRIGSVQRALQVLGTNATRGIAAAACLDRMLVARAASSGHDMQALMQHSLAVAQLSQDLARVLAPGRAADAYLAGLLHDLGFVVLAQLSREQAARLPHPVVATIVFRAWSLPEWLQAAVGAHHDVECVAGDSVDADPLARIVAVADQIAAAEGFGFSADEAAPVAPEPTDLGAEVAAPVVDADTLRSITSELSTRVREQMAALAG